MPRGKLDLAKMVLKSRDLDIKIIHEIWSNITYDSKNLFHPSEMIIKGAKKSLKWNGKRLIEITRSTYEYNSEGTRTKKTTPNETTTFELGGSNIILGTTSLIEDGLAMAGFAIPGSVVVRSVILLSMGFEWLIREITGYKD